MQIHVSKNISDQFSFTNDRTGANLPARSGPWEHVKDVDLAAGGEHQGVTADDILDGISSNGHFVADHHKTINEV